MRKDDVPSLVSLLANRLASAKMSNPNSGEKDKKYYSVTDLKRGTSNYAVGESVCVGTDGHTDDGRSTIYRNVVK